MYSVNPSILLNLLKNKICEKFFLFKSKYSVYFFHTEGDNAIQTQNRGPRPSQRHVEWNRDENPNVYNNSERVPLASAHYLSTMVSK